MRGLNTIEGVKSQAAPHTSWESAIMGRIKRSCQLRWIVGLLQIIANHCKSLRVTDGKECYCISIVETVTEAVSCIWHKGTNKEDS